MSEECKCHMCGEVTDSECEDCGEPVCVGCTVSYTIQNQCDWTQCQDCGDFKQEERAEEGWREEEAMRFTQKEREKINASARKRYHSPAQVEERRLAKIELAEKRRRYALRSKEEVLKILQGFRL